MSKILGISLALAMALVAIPTLMISASGPWAHQSNVVTDSDSAVLGKVRDIVNGAAPAGQAVSSSTIEIMVRPPFDEPPPVTTLSQLENCRTCASV